MLALQGYVTQKKTHPHRTLPQACSWGPMGVPRGGGRFLIGEVPLHASNPRYLGVLEVGESGGEENPAPSPIPYTLTPIPPSRSGPYTLNL